MAKFKKGDKVRCLRNSSGGFVAGAIYTVLYCMSDIVFVDRDSQGDRNGWGVQNFELVKEESEPTEKVLRWFLYNDFSGKTYDFVSFKDAQDHVTKAGFDPEVCDIFAATKVYSAKVVSSVTWEEVN